MLLQTPGLCHKSRGPEGTPQERLAIATCLLPDELCQQAVTTKLRSRGFATALSDAEIITIQAVGEALGLNDDKKTGDILVE